MVYMVEGVGAGHHGLGNDVLYCLLTPGFECRVWVLVLGNASRLKCWVLDTINGFGARHHVRVMKGV